jgi:autophagy-related protein 17
MLQEWDIQRVQRTEALDTMLDSLGSQVVPPDFHHPDVDEDVFTSPEENDPFASHTSSHASESSDHDALSSPATIRGELPTTNGIKLDGPKRRRQDRKTWKTLRDFVDERGIEDALDKMEQERMILEDILLSTADFPSTITDAVTSLKEALPGTLPKAQDIVREVLEHQERTSVAMATHLESLAVHFDQMEVAQRDSDAGEVFGDEDLQGLTLIYHRPLMLMD